MRAGQIPQGVVGKARISGQGEMKRWGGEGGGERGKVVEKEVDEKGSDEGE